MTVQKIPGYRLGYTIQSNNAQLDGTAMHLNYTMSKAKADAWVADAPNNYADPEDLFMCDVDNFDYAEQQAFRELQHELRFGVSA